MGSGEGSDSPALIRQFVDEGLGNSSYLAASRARRPGSVKTAPSFHWSMAVKTAAAVAVILVVVMVLALLFVFPLRRATLVIDVKSNHIFATVGFRLLLDSKLIGSGMLAPFSTTRYTWELNWTFG